MADIQKGYTFTNGETVTPVKLHALVDDATVADGSIGNSKISASAAIAHSKLDNIPAGRVLLGNVSNVPTPTALSGDVTVSSTGVTAIVAGVVVDADINASAAIALSKLATGALPTGITVASANIVNGTIIDADISATAAIADTKLATISTAGKVANSATTANSANTANAIVARDASSNFSAGTITANLAGNASSASTLQTARSINGVSFNGSADITVTANPTSHTHGNITSAGAIGSTANLPVITGTGGVLQAGSFGTAAGSFCQGTDSRLSDQRTPTDGSVTNTKVSAAAAIADTKLATISTAGKVANSATTADSANTANAIVARDASSNFSAGTITANLTGNASGSAATWATARNLAFTGDVTATLSSVNGSANVSAAATIANNAVTTTKLATATQQSLVPAGAIMPFAMNTAPSGWLEANGTEYSKTGTYAALFAAIGTTYGETNGSGGIGTTHFRLPDLRGIFVRGINSQTISGVTYSGTLGTKQNDTFKDHDHPIAARVSTNTSTEITAGQYLASINNNFSFNYILAGTTTVPTLGLTGSTGATETCPANIALLYCIKI